VTATVPLLAKRLAHYPRGMAFSRDGGLSGRGDWRGIVYLWRMPGLFDVA
jgi:hypothetical protein